MIKASSTAWPPGKYVSTTAASDSSGLNNRSGVDCLLELSRGTTLITISGESNVFPSELVYLTMTWSRSSSTKASSRIGTRVGDPPGRLTQILRGAISTLTGALRLALLLGPPLWNNRAGSRRLVKC